MRPAGVIAKTKDNSKKKYREHDEWLVAKKIGRIKQVWIPPVTVTDRESTITIGVGHWEKV
jgi:hypothetical protein